VFQCREHFNCARLFSPDALPATAAVSENLIFHFARDFRPTEC
jgi:hypothetical protein